jgi:hypothetical protein
MQSPRMVGRIPEEIKIIWGEPCIVPREITGELK